MVGNAFKRLFDLLLASTLLLMLAPIMLLIAVAIRLDSAGPALYRGRRIGRHGRPFHMFKFRTMVVDADQIGGSSTADTDPRITRLGRRLRRAKLDELPQLMNVVWGDMSLVGPRPEVSEYVELFTPEESVILSVRPGITDLATLRNSDEGALLAGAPDPDRIYLEKIRPEKIRLQLAYVRTRSLCGDLKILLATASTVLTQLSGTGRKAPPSS